MTQDDEILEAAVQSPPIVGVRALEWRHDERMRGSFKRQSWTAASGFGSYRISLNEDDTRAPGQFYLHADFAFRAEFYPTLESAKAAAQADYETRIRSALSSLAPVEAPESRKEAEERVMQDYRWGNLTPLGVANHLRRAGFNLEYATAKANTLAPVEAVATEPVAWQTRMRPTGAKVWGDWHFGKMTADDTDGWEWEERALGVIAPTGDSGALREALARAAEGAYGILWRDVGRASSEKSIAARKELFAALTKDGQRRGINYAIELYGSVTEAEVINIDADEEASECMWTDKPCTCGGGDCEQVDFGASKGEPGK